MDFPGYDNAERKGWDGLLEAGAATPWIPEGRSCWEFSTRRDPGRKAIGDYATRTRSVSSEERSQCTFVFVTVRNWPGKNEWESRKNASGEWKAVRAFDASDLEQWLEESIPAQIWLAERLGLPAHGVETLDRYWERWAAASDPKMSPAVFEATVERSRGELKEWLEKESERPFVVTAESKGEAIAFLACLFQDDEIAERWGDLPAVFESADSLRRLADSSIPFVPISSTDEATRELADVCSRLHCIVVSHRNAVNSKPDINFDLPNRDAFVKALESMSIGDDRADRLARDSGCSPTILRRRLSQFDAIRTPDWARSERTARELIPMALIGAWHAQSRADREVLEVLANRSYEEVERSVARLLQFDDSPVWSAGEYRGVVSKMDALFAVNKYLIEKDLNEFFSLAKHVLSEVDPALDLPEDHRWEANLYGKSRKHSSSLRAGVCETLVILSVYGNDLFPPRRGTDLKIRVDGLIRELLAPLTLEKLLSHGHDLPRYAEAAPEEFLSLLENDLRQQVPVTLGLLKPVDSGPFSSPQRSGLLWALECLAWKHIGRVSLILARLSRTEIDDNWANKPIGSLEAIYRSWMPQTAASLEERMMALETLTQRYPNIGWQICMEPFCILRPMGMSSYRPRWRNDASGVGQPLTRTAEILRFEDKALEIVLSWPTHDHRTLGDLIERVYGVPEAARSAIWDQVDAWAASTNDDSLKASLRERLRRFAYARIGQRPGMRDPARDRARRAFNNLQPGDIVVRHAWLFANHWIDFAGDEIPDGEIDYKVHAARINELRVAAIREIWTERGFEGVQSLLSRCGVAATVGSAMGRIIDDTNARVDFLRHWLSVRGGLDRQFDGCIEGFLTSVQGNDERDAILSAVADDSDPERTVRVFRCAPFEQRTWCLLDKFGKEVRDLYWREVLPTWGRHSEAELMELIDRLLEAERPRAAFHAVQFDWQRIETFRLKRLLYAVATVTAEPEDHYRLEAYRISEALEFLDGRPGVSPDEMAQLEFMYVQALDGSKHRFPNLERQISESPEAFFQALSCAFRRRDHGEDPPEWRIDDPERRAAMAVSCHRVLDRMSRIPGTGTDGQIDAESLSAWVTQVRRMCAEHDRTENGDRYIGKLLARSTDYEDGYWPCRAVCQVMERFASQDIGIGFEIGVYNARGVVKREIGGGQERALAEKYRNLARQREIEYPYVGGVLNEIARAYDREAQRWDVEAEIDRRRIV